MRFSAVAESPISSVAGDSAFSMPCAQSCSRVCGKLYTTYILQPLNTNVREQRGARFAFRNKLMLNYLKTRLFSRFESVCLNVYVFVGKHTFIYSYATHKRATLVRTRKPRILYAIYSIQEYTRRRRRNAT